MSPRRHAYAPLAASLLGLTAHLATTQGAWPLALAGLTAPDLALLAGAGAGLAPGQLHPRAVGLYNAVHRFIGPVALVAVGATIPGVAWGAHVALDRAVGYGLRDRRGFQRA